jgi:formate hydrogenlyase subunit 3/multisubunit Na+/H+ antiporter MnhD subunit
MTAALWSLIGLPALVGAVLPLGGRRAERAAPAVALATSAVVLALAIAVAIGRPTASAPFLPVAPLALVVDGLAAVVAVTVAAVTLLVLLGAAAEIGDGRARFFGLMLLFLAAVLLTVTAATLVGLLLAWEVMGATSYALIAHHWRNDRHVGSGTTAFLVTRTGDLGLYLAAGAALAAGAGLGLAGLDELPGPWLHLAAAGVLAAAFGKAAQLPFTFWLSRAMDGPSTVSALLHSAAMVAMGSYLLLRLAPLLGATGWAATAAAWGGAITALVLGAVAVAQSDLKQLLAASTSSQLGFVILGAGTAAHGGVVGGTGQLVAHAAVKAGLFLAAGRGWSRWAPATWAHCAAPPGPTRGSGSASRSARWHWPGYRRCRCGPPRTRCSPRPRSSRWRCTGWGWPPRCSRRSMRARRWGCCCALTPIWFQKGLARPLPTPIWFQKGLARKASRAGPGRSARWRRPRWRSWPPARPGWACSRCPA